MQIKFDYQPAHVFARRAQEWNERTMALADPKGIGEPPMPYYCILFCRWKRFSMSNLMPGCTSGRDDFLKQHKYASLTTRWLDALKKFTASDLN